MNKKTYTTFILLATFLFACAQNEQEIYNRYEKKALKYFNQQFDDHQINWNDIETTFEVFFETIEVTQGTDNDTIEYYKIIDYLQHSGGYSEYSKNVDSNITELTVKLEKFNLNRDIANNCLFRFYDYYLDNKKFGNTPKNFHVVGTNISFLKKDKNIDPGLFMGALKLGGYDKKLYKRALALRC